MESRASTQPRCCGALGWRREATTSQQEGGDTPHFDYHASCQNVRRLRDCEPCTISMLENQQRRRPYKPLLVRPFVPSSMILLVPVRSILTPGTNTHAPSSNDPGMGVIAPSASKPVLMSLFFGETTAIGEEDFTTHTFSQPPFVARSPSWPSFFHAPRTKTVVFGQCRRFCAIRRAKHSRLCGCKSTISIWPMSTFYLGSTAYSVGGT